MRDVRPTRRGLLLLAGETVRLINVYHAYGRQGGANGPILNGIDLDVPAGEFVAIHGRSGAGKSTLLHIAGGILPPLRGEVIVGGRDLFRLSDRDLSAFRNRLIGFIFQSYYLAPVLTAVENVMVPALLAGYSLSQSRKRAGEKLEEVGLADKARARPGELSGGQMQRVAIARALVNEPSLLLADEPTGNLDEQTGGDVLALLGRYHRERRLTVIMATHDASVEMHATQQLYLVGGQLYSHTPEPDKPAAGPPSEAS
jgi:ABC-type lipoprotein export system ATPase subunit